MQVRFLPDPPERKTACPFFVVVWSSGSDLAEGIGSRTRPLYKFVVFHYVASEGPPQPAGKSSCRTHQNNRSPIGRVLFLCECGLERSLRSTDSRTLSLLTLDIGDWALDITAKPSKIRDMRKWILTSLSIIYLTQWLPPVWATAPLQIAGVILGDADLSVNIQQISPNDPLFLSQSYLSVINVPSAWGVTTGSNIPIAVVDTGIDLSHEDLIGKLWVNSDEIPNNGIDDDHNGYIDDYNGYNFLNNNADLRDVHGHGTGIASIIAAQTNNGKGMAGINWQAPIMVLKALNSAGGGDFSTVARATRYAADNGAKIINMSFGAIDNYSDLADAVNYALDRQITVVAAVGNNHGQGIFYPAAYSSVIAVSSIGDNGHISTFSNYGVGVDLAAPGENILMAGSSANNNSSYVRGSGSSFAAAEVTGIVSLLLARYPNLSPVQISSILKSTAISLSGDPNDIYVGAGRVDANQAVNYQTHNFAGRINFNRTTVPADGLTSAIATLTVNNEFNQPQSNLPVTVRVGGNNNLVNNTLAGGDINLGNTNALGQISFTLASNVAETKRLEFFSGASAITLSSSGNLVFNITRGLKHSMSWVRQSPYPTMHLGDTATIWVEVKNTGNVAWISDKSAVNAKGQMRLGTDRPANRESGFYDVNSWISRDRPAAMIPSVVYPGEIARFEITLRANQNGKFREYFRPVVEYIAWLNDLGIYWDVTVTNSNIFDINNIFNSYTSTNFAEYSADIRGKTNNITLSPNESAGLWVDLVNTGSAAWMPAGADLKSTGAVRLGTTTPRDRVSPFYSSSWLSSNRVMGTGIMVSPNGTLELYFSVKAPAQTGVYQENLQLVSEYVGWFGPIFGWTITVK